MGFCSAQQNAASSLASFNKYQFNPAFAGLDNSLSLNLGFRSQWTGLIEAPQFMEINGHLPLYRLKGAAGMRINNESAGLWSQTGVEFSYNYVFDRSFGLFSFGTSLGVLQGRLNGRELITPDGVYEGSTVDHQDPILGTAELSEVGLSSGIGFYGLMEFLEFGISAKNLPEWNSSFSQFGLFANTLYNFYGEYKWRLRENLRVHPILRIQSDLNETQVESLVIVKYNGNVFGGVGMRGFSETSLESLLVIAGIKINPNLTLHYSYDAGFSQIRRVSEGSHEILINYNLNKLLGEGQLPRIIHNPRHL